MCKSHYQKWQYRNRGAKITPQKKQSRFKSPMEILDQYMPKGLPEHTCWEWTGPRKWFGHGSINHSVDGIRYHYPAHRIAWERAHGRSIPDGMVVRHSCDNPPCVNPAHLELGTQADNVRDRTARDRAPTIANGRNTELAKSRSKLTIEQLAEAKELRAATGLSYARLGRHFGVSEMTMYRAINGQRYKWAT